MSLLRQCGETRLTTSCYPRYRERLEKLIVHLEEVARRDPGSFNLNFWMASDSQYDLRQALRTWSKRWKAGETLNCGTTACLAGHLPLVFPGEFAWERDGNYWAGSFSGVHVRCKTHSGFLELSTADLERFFGISFTFWDQTIHTDEGFWEGKPSPVTVADMVTLLRAAQGVADKECPQTK